MEVIKPVMPENASIKPTLAFSKLEMEFEMASIKPITRSPNTIEEAATIRTTTLEKPSAHTLEEDSEILHTVLNIAFSKEFADKCQD